MFGIILVFAILKLASGGVIIHQILENPGIYFENIGRTEFYSNEWKIVTYYDLSCLNKALYHISRHVDEVNNLCTESGENNNFGIICNSTVTEMNHLMTDIHQKLNLVKIHKRSKRGLFNVVGILSKTLFGTLNEDDAKFYDRQIEKVQINENHLLSLIKNQTIIVDTTDNILNKTRHDIENQIATLDTKFQKLKAMIDDLNNVNHHQQVYLEMESLISLTTLMKMRYQNVVDTIVDLVTSGRHGKPHPTLITPEQLQAVLNTIRIEMPADLRLPSGLKDNSILPLYQISTVSATVRNDKIIYELRIPLPHKGDYQLYKIIPFPTRVQNKLIFLYLAQQWYH